MMKLDKVFGHRISAKRFWLMSFGVAALFTIVILRVYYLAVIRGELLHNELQVRSQRSTELQSLRAEIIDAKGAALAISIPAYKLGLRAQPILNSDQAIEKISAITGQDAQHLRAKVAGRKSTFTWVDKYVTPQMAFDLGQLNIDGIELFTSYRRIYPKGSTTAPLIGLIDTSTGAGIDGLELSLNEQLLQDANTVTTVSRDRYGHAISSIHGDTATQKQAVQLTVDGYVQTVAFSALQQQVLESDAESASAVVIDVQTGEILAVATYPSYNPHNRSSITVRRLRPLTDMVEPGSTIKPFVAAAALTSGEYDFDSVIDTGNGEVRIDDQQFLDPIAYGELSVAQVLARSSQVGAIKMVLGFESQHYSDVLRRFGFGTRTGLSFPSDPTGLVPDYGDQSLLNRATLGFGYGLEVSLLQLTQAYATIARRGAVIFPKLLKQKINDDSGYQAIPVETADYISRALELAVSSGTAKAATIDGYRVAGKTGTVHIASSYGYESDLYRALFVGFAPASQPRFAVGVMVEKPNPNKYFGGQVAAPVFKAIMERSLLHHNVAKDRQR